jgi:LIVCS family branched-chain amino acid:cation transporter
MTQPAVSHSPACKNNFLSYLKISTPVGLALFAMFFGAGNLVYPLAIGVEAGQHIWAAVLGFILMGVGIPWFGVYVSSLYQGSSTAFFSRLGSIPGKIIAGIILILIGILVANPRTATVTANTVEPFFPDFKGQQALIQGIFFALVYLASAKSQRVVEILGYFFSPLKLILLFLLIVASLVSMQAWQGNTLSVTHVFSSAIINGYNTMDLFASVFFCGIAYSAIKRRAQQQGISDPKIHRRLSLLACVSGAIIIAVVYLGFILAAAGHSDALTHVPTAKLITVLSEQTLGTIAAAAVAAVVSFACLGRYLYCFNGGRHSLYSYWLV